MITQLYTFSPSSYVVADEWNANFQTIYNTNVLHAEAVVDGYDTIAFPTSDFTDLFNAIKGKPNSSLVTGSMIDVAPEQEYYKVLSNGQDLVINIPTGLDSESRIIVQMQGESSLSPFIINYDGEKQESYGVLDTFPAGMYMLFIYETNGLAQIKITKMGA